MNKDQILYYSKRAAEYEKVYDKPERQKDLFELKDLISNFYNGKNVFEVACGTGYWTQYISRSAHSVLATDVNESVLSIAQTKSYDCPVRFKLADIYDLGNASSVFTGGFAGFIWSHIPRQELAGFLEGFVKNLKPESDVLLVDNVFSSSSSTPVHSEDEYGNTFQLRKLKDGSKHLVLKNFPGKTDLLQLADTVGTNVQVTESDYYWTLKFRVKHSVQTRP